MSDRTSNSCNSVIKAEHEIESQAVAELKRIKRGSPSGVVKLKVNLIFRADNVENAAVVTAARM
jgi:hypothetical protein